MKRHNNTRQSATTFSEIGCKITLFLLLKCVFLDFLPKLNRLKIYSLKLFLEKSKKNGSNILAESKKHPTFAIQIKWRDGRGARHRSAKPYTPVRIRFSPPTSNSLMLLVSVSVFAYILHAHARQKPSPPDRAPTTHLFS